MPQDFNILTLLSLLDDDDIWQQVANDLVKNGTEIAEELRNYCWVNQSDLNEIQLERLEYILQRINFKHIYKQFHKWVKTPEPALTDALNYIASYVYPTFDDSNNIIENKIEHICDDVEIRLTLDMSMPEIIDQINQVMFEVYQFTIAENDEVYNFALSYLLSYKKGSPALLCLLYLIVAQKLGLPFYPVFLEQHLILGALNRSSGSSLIARSMGKTKAENYFGNLDFFIDPADKGSKFGKMAITQYLNQHNLPVEGKYFTPCSNLQAISFFLLSFSGALYAKNDEYSTDEINSLLDLLDQYK